MNFSHIRAIASRKFSSIKRDKRMFAFIVLMPAIQILLFGFAIGGSPDNLHIAVVGENALTDELAESDLLIIENVDDVESGIDMVEAGEAWAVVNASGSSIQIHFDASNQQIMQTIFQEVRLSLEAVSQQQGMVQLPIEQMDPIYGVENPEFIDFLAPGIMVLVCFMFSIILTSMAFVGERSDGTLDRVFAAGVAPGDVLIGHLFAFSSVLVGQVGVVIFISLAVFDITIEGSVLLLSALALLLGWSSMCFGLFISSKAKSEFQAMQLNMPLLFPALLLSGILWPVEALPSWLIPVSKVLPTTWSAEAFRSIMMRGWGLESPVVWQAFLVVGLFGIVTLLLARVSLKTRS